MCKLLICIRSVYNDVVIHITKIIDHHNKIIVISSEFTFSSHTYRIPLLSSFLTSPFPQACSHSPLTEREGCLDESYTNLHVEQRKRGRGWLNLKIIICNVMTNLQQMELWKHFVVHNITRERLVSCCEIKREVSYGEAKEWL